MDRKKITEKRRRRIERMKVCIRSFCFVKRNFIIGVCIAGLCISVAALGIFYYRRAQDTRMLREQQEQLLAQKAETPQNTETVRATEADTEGEEQEQTAAAAPELLAEYASLYETNSDLIGWLSIEDTKIDYPVMQTPEDEQYYLYRDFNGEENINGCLIMDTDSTVGVGTKEQSYMYLSAAQTVCTTPPSTNLIIHGHTMKSGEMFGDLDLYADEEYGREHSLICFDSLYEHREYELIAAFYSQVYYEQEQVFKYYKFFQADTQEQFDDWYDNIRALSLYDTGVSAKFGDEFITLSCCAYHVENGRFVVVGKRVK